MSPRISASDAKNNFGSLLDSVSALGRVDIVRHGRVVAVVLAPRELEALSEAAHSFKARMPKPPGDLPSDPRLRRHKR